MRLLDRVVASPPKIEAAAHDGRIHVLTGVGAQAHALRDCPLRFMLDREASHQCFELIRSAKELFEADSTLLRLPAESFWIEWFAEAAERGGPGGGRLGAFVNASADGRRGSITGYYETSGGQADLVVASAEFDLDKDLRQEAADPRRVSFRHRDLRHLDDLLRHSVLRLDATWVPFLRAHPPARFQELLVRLTDAAWYYVPFVLAFSAMLNSREVLERVPSNLHRLNEARARRGRTPLLEHINVKLRLGAAAGGSGLLTSGTPRAAPRLHYVRGHLVRRSGSSFWRSAHLRGDAERPILTKTISVVGQKVTGQRQHRLAMSAKS